MPSITFKNLLDQEIQVTVDGRAKALLTANEAIMLDVREGQEVSFTGEGALVVTRTTQQLTAPTAALPAPTPNRNAMDNGSKRTLRPAVQVEQLDARTGEVITTHTSMNNAARAVGASWWDFAKFVNSGNESEYMGFRWRKAGQAGTKTKAGRAGKPVIQRSKDGQALRTWASQSEASKVLRIPHSSISRACYNPKVDAGGFHWEFAA